MRCGESMPDVIRRLTQELAADPTSLVVLELAESLRQSGQLVSAWKVARAGLGRYPEVADAHDLCARILADQGDRAAARDAWRRALELAPHHVGAHKGLAFICFCEGDLQSAMPHLEAARAAAPQDEGVATALARLRVALEGIDVLSRDRAVQAAMAAPVRAPVAEPEEELADDELGPGIVVLDGQGLRLAGDLTRADGASVGDAVAAHLAGVAREAARAARLLELGEWQHVSAESADGNVLVLAPTPTTALVIVRPAEVPVGRLALLAEQAARRARVMLADLT
jgi:predicted regulator of Ras-like GTPase activity (Roadblock/LC7/MglB family)/predicted Zn-dependent protease